MYDITFENVQAGERTSLLFRLANQVNGLVGQIIQDGENTFDIMDFLGFGRVVSLAIVVGVIDVILMTALATLAAFLYNVSSSLVGGLQLTLTDD